MTARRLDLCHAGVRTQQPPASPLAPITSLLPSLGSGAGLPPVGAHPCSFQGPLGWHLRPTPIAVPVSPEWPGCLGTLPGCLKGLDGGPGMNPAPKGAETRVPAQLRSLWPQGVGSVGAGARAHCRMRWLNAVFFKE